MSNLTIIILLFMFIFGSSCGRLSSNSYKTRNDVMDAYLVALSEKDTNKILELVAPNYEAEVEVKHKINEYGGLNLENVQVHYHLTESSYHVTAVLQAEMPQTEGRISYITDTLHLKREGNSWFLMLGVPNRQPPAAHKSATAIR